MYIGLKQLRGDGERYVTPARAAAKETTVFLVSTKNRDLWPSQRSNDWVFA